jgi:hypothetical protein
MKKENFFLKGILVLALVFVVFLTGCENDNSPTVVAVTPALSGPVVTAKAVNAGVLLTWPAVIETSSYQVWRTTSGQASPIKIGTVSDSTGNQTAGVVAFLDAVDATKEHSLRSNTEYTYSVVAVPAAVAKDSGRTNVTVRTGNLLPAGEKAAQPVDADLAIDFGTGNVTLTITPPTSGNIPNAYVFNLPGLGSTAVYYDGSAASLTYTAALTQTSLLSYYIGDLTVTINGSLGNSTYYQASDPYVLKKTVAPLFSGDISITGFYIYTSTTSYAITKFGAKIDLDSITPKPGVTYTLERAKQTNNPAANWVWTTPSLYSTASYSSSTLITDLTQDIFGNFPAFGVDSTTGGTSTYSSVVYDQNIPFDEAEGIWTYRLKAERDGITDYRQVSREIDFWNLLLSSTGGEFEILMPEAGNYTDGTSRYKFQPSFDPDYQNLLKDGDKVVIYWVRGGAFAYQYGAFSTANSITFTKQDLTGYTTYLKEAKTLSVPRSSGTNTFLFVQIYLESPNRESKVISSYLSDDNDWVYSNYYVWQNGQASRRLAY